MSELQKLQEKLQSKHSNEQRIVDALFQNELAWGMFYFPHHFRSKSPSFHLKIIKEASGNLEQCMRIYNSTNDGFCLISGDDLLTLPILSLGGVGVISVLSNAFPAHFKNIVSNFKSGKIDVARETIFELLDLNTLMYKESNPVGIKEVLRQLDICKNHVRLPLETASESLTNEINLIMGSLNMRM